MEFDEIIQKLEFKLKTELPGHKAQQIMMPVESTRARFDLDKTDVRRGGVLILIYKIGDAAYIPLTQRHDYGGTHGGQVSLPGGKLEEGDDNIMSTALRETHEEIGVQPERVNIIGELTDLYIPPSNFRVTPFVGFVNEKPQFNIDTFEVKELIETPMAHLLDKSKRKRKDITVRNGFRLNAPYFDVHGKVVWGATAMILAEFVSLLQEQ